MAASGGDLMTESSQVSAEQKQHPAFCLSSVNYGAGMHSVHCTILPLSDGATNTTNGIGDLIFDQADNFESNYTERNLLNLAYCCK